MSIRLVLESRPLWRTKSGSSNEFTSLQKAIVMIGLIPRKLNY